MQHCVAAHILSVLTMGVVVLRRSTLGQTEPKNLKVFLGFGTAGRLAIVTRRVTEDVL